jgi:hypothetical protein
MGMKVCAAVLYCPAANSELFSVNFLQGLNEEIAMLISLILGDFDCRKQKEPLHFPDAWKHREAVGYITLLKRTVLRTRVVMQKEKT